MPRTCLPDAGVVDQRCEALGIHHPAIPTSKVQTPPTTTTTRKSTHIFTRCAWQVSDTTKPCKELSSRLLREAKSIRGRHGVFESGTQRLSIYDFRPWDLIQTTLWGPFDEQLPGTFIIVAHGDKSIIRLVHPEPVTESPK